ncbi:BAG family molecular chaperone regulator 1 [Platanthera zijinensis]|uniref:BAG family molecular chaperone regulator 1 n=1 Tax=Platanthera zijinensis TaxID=2320716 RepID=A0AAP0GGN9_9ASPA
MRTKYPSTAAVGPLKAFSPVKDTPATIPAETPMEDPAKDPAKWEVRPCGMLVQKRSAADGRDVAPVPVIRLRVKHASNHHEVYISSQATFGELRKLLAERTGIHPLDQKILFKDKERDSSAYLDTSGVKDRSKLVVVEDSAAQARRFLEMRRTAKLEKDVKFIFQISLDVDKLASQVSALEGVISKGGKVADTEVLRLTELLMNELIKLDGVTADGDVKLQRRMQVKRVQKYVETLDVIKLKNANPNAVEPAQQQKQKKPPPPPPTASAAAPPQPDSVIVTTKWETFDSLFSPLASASSSTATSTAASSAAPTPRFDWELF